MFRHFSRRSALRGICLVIYYGNHVFTAMWAWTLYQCHFISNRFFLWISRMRMQIWSEVSFSLLHSFSSHGENVYSFAIATIYIYTSHVSLFHYRKIGFYGVFTMAGLLYSVALFYGIFVLKEVPPKKLTTIAEAAAATIEKSAAVKKSMLADFFDFAHVRETFRVAFKSGQKNRRSKIIMLMVVVIIVIGPQHGTCLHPAIAQKTYRIKLILIWTVNFSTLRTGEMSLFYLFTRYKFNWSEVEFSFFSTYNMAIHLIGKYSHFIFSSDFCGLLHEQTFFHRHNILGQHIL